MNSLLRHKRFKNKHNRFFFIIETYIGIANSILQISILIYFVGQSTFLKVPNTLGWFFTNQPYNGNCNQRVNLWCPTSMVETTNPLKPGLPGTFENHPTTRFESNERRDSFPGA